MLEYIKLRSFFKGLADKFGNITKLLADKEWIIGKIYSVIANF
jgi:hypothetical protein